MFQHSLKEMVTEQNKNINHPIFFIYWPVLLMHFLQKLLI